MLNHSFIHSFIQHYWSSEIERNHVVACSWAYLKEEINANWKLLTALSDQRKTLRSYRHDWESRKALTEYREFEFGHEFPVLPSKQRAEHLQRPRGRNQCKEVRVYWQNNYAGRLLGLTWKVKFHPRDHRRLGWQELAFKSQVYWSIIYIKLNFTLLGVQFYKFW